MTIFWINLNNHFVCVYIITVSGGSAEWIAAHPTHGHRSKEMLKCQLAYHQQQYLHTQQKGRRCMSRKYILIWLSI